MTEEVPPAMPAISVDLGVLTIYAARGVRQNCQHPSGSDIISPKVATVFNG